MIFFKGKKIYLLIAAFLLVAQNFYSQTKITGKVTNQSNAPIENVAILIKETKKGTFSNQEGNYIIGVSYGQTLEFSSLGYVTQEVTFNKDTIINIVLKEDGTALEEVVLTALNLEKKKKSIGYGTSSIPKEAIENNTETDILRRINGKAAGLNVLPTGGLAGSGANVNIRGNTSINQNNQALIVVDGVPYNNNVNLQDFENLAFTNGLGITQNRLNDIDPNTIENIEILKGLSATTLYGKQGKNGVILITTKNTVRKRVTDLEISIDQSFFNTQISSLPDYQNTYGQGSDNDVLGTGTEFSLEDKLKFIGSWGAPFTDNITVPHHYSNAVQGNNDNFGAFPEFQNASVTYRAFENNVKNFFQNGFGRNTAINASKGFENIAFNLNLSNTNEEGFTPGNELKKTSISVGTAIDFTKKLNIQLSSSYTNNDYITPPVAPTGEYSVFARTLFIPRSFDLNGLPYQNPITGQSVFYRDINNDIENPNWIVDNSQFGQETERFFNTLSANYEINNKWSVEYRLGLDIYNEDQQFFINKGGVSNTRAKQGYLRTTKGENETIDQNLIAKYKNDLTENIGLNALVGFNNNSNFYRQTGLASIGQQEFGVLDHDNFTDTSSEDLSTGVTGFDLDFQVRENLLGAYTQFEFDYNDYLFLNLSARNDWSSTLPKENNSIFYPSASIAFIATEGIPSLKSDGLNYLKLRAGYGTSGAFPEPYLINQTLFDDTRVFIDRDGNSVSTNSLNELLANPDLKPEIHREFELGLDASFWKQRINLGASLYKRISKDQITNTVIDPSRGFDDTFVNIGKIESKGIELTLDLKPFKNNKSPFKWNSKTLFTATENKVTELPSNVAQISIAGFTNIGNFAIEGEPLGVILGNYAVTDENGNFLINKNNGTLIGSDTVGLDDRIIGDPNPDFKMNFINSFSYKGFTLSSQFDYTQGGDIYSETIQNLLIRGVTRDTEDRDQTLIIPGVLAEIDNNTGKAVVLTDANGIPISNNIQKNVNRFYFDNQFNPLDQSIFDGTVFRLREIALGYEVPKKWLKNAPLNQLSVTAFGQNLWFYTPNIPKHTNFDPETISTGVGNGMGLDFQTAPNAKKYGLNIKATF